MNFHQKLFKGCSNIERAFLPSEIIINILSRLPVNDVIRCKCVCKSWLELLSTPEFAEDHLSKSVPGLILSDEDAFRIFDFVDEFELDHHGIRHNLVKEFDESIFTNTPPHGAMGVECSVNGLLLLWGNFPPFTLFACNPITREYIEFPRHYMDLSSEYFKLYTQGFGISVTSGQYKVVRIFWETTRHETFEHHKLWKSKCWVYTLGTRAWRAITPCPYYDYGGSTPAFSNGNLHWLVDNIYEYGSKVISCFNLESEVFSTFSPPPPLGKPSYRNDAVVFGDCLCICETSKESDHEIVFWLMKEYGNESSWTKQFVITKDLGVGSLTLAFVLPLRLFTNGDILLLWGPYLMFYSKKTNIAENLDLFEIRENRFLEARVHVSSFLSLTRFALETVITY